MASTTLLTRRMGPQRVKLSGGSWNVTLSGGIEWNVPFFSLLCFLCSDAFVFFWFEENNVISLNFVGSLFDFVARIIFAFRNYLETVYRG